MHRLLAQLIRDVPLTGQVPSDVMALLTHFDCRNTARHCQQVADMAEQLAARFGDDPTRARIAGWLHDVGALFPIAQRASAARELRVEIVPEEELAPMLLHQKLSAVVARDVLSVVDEAILGAIECHTTLKAGASLLDKVVFVADKVAWDQPGAPPYLKDITQALDRSLGDAVTCYLEYLWQRQDTLAAVHPWFVQAYYDVQRQACSLHAQQTTE